MGSYPLHLQESFELPSTTGKTPKHNFHKT